MRSFRYGAARALLAAGLGVCALGASQPQDEQQPTGGFDLTKDADKRLYERYAHRENIKVDKVDPIFRAERVSHVASGVALRDRTRGFIHSRGVPTGSEIVRSFLFWNFSDTEKEGADSAPILFDGNLINGRKRQTTPTPAGGAPATTPTSPTSPNSPIKQGGPTRTTR